MFLSHSLVHEHAHVHVHTHAHTHTHTRYNQDCRCTLPPQQFI
jgi:hypothetical protein